MRIGLPVESRMSGNAHVRFGGVGRGDRSLEMATRRLAPTLPIEVGSRRVVWARSTATPDTGSWVVQQARNLLLNLPEGAAPRLLVRDRDAKYAGAFDEVFRAEGTRVIRTPVRAPRANAYAERWVRTVRAESLDHLLILSRAHLDRVLAE